VFKEDEHDRSANDWGLSLRSRRTLVKGKSIHGKSGAGDEQRKRTGGAPVTRQYEYDLVEYDEGSNEASPSASMASHITPSMHNYSYNESHSTVSPELRSASPQPDAAPVVLTEDNVDKYFGVKAQHHYNATFRELHARRQLCAGGDDELLSLISTPLAPITRAGSRTGSRGTSRKGGRESGGSRGGSRQGARGDSVVGGEDASLLSSYGSDALSQSVKQLRKHRVLDPLASSSPGVGAEIGLELFAAGSVSLDESTTGSVVSTLFASPVNPGVGGRSEELSRSADVGGSSVRSSRSGKKSFYVLPRQVAATKGRSSRNSRLHNIKYPCGPHTKQAPSGKLAPLFPSLEDGLATGRSGLGDSASVMSDITLSASVDLEEENLGGDDFEMDDPHDLGNLLYNHYDASRADSSPSRRLQGVGEKPAGEASFGVVTADVTAPLLDLAGLKIDPPPVREVSSEVLLEDSEFQTDASLATYAPNSPRAKFLAGCLKFNLPPRSLAILRHRYTSILNLEHHGLGDKFGLLFAQSFASLPVVRVLNIADNRLTDVSLGPLMQAVRQSRTLEELNLSDNQIGPVCAETLATYMSSPSCSIVYLKLSKLKLTDATVMKLTGAMTANARLQELDLSSNLLGQEETLVFMHPDRVTGGESIGKLVRNAAVSALTTLKLQWNFIRGIGAMDLCDSLRSKNSSVTHLDLSFNSIGNDGGAVLGSALLENKVLKELHVASNNITAEVCFALCVGAKDSVLDYLNIDNNPIGGLGAQMLMSLAIAKRDDMTFSAMGSDLTAKSEAHVVNINDPVGSYELTLSSALGRAISLELLDICARNPVFRIQQFVVLPEGGDPDSGDFDTSRPSPKKLTSRPASGKTGSAGNADGGSEGGQLEPEEEEVDYGDWVPTPLDLFEEEVSSLADVERELVEHLKTHSKLVDDMPRVDACFHKHKEKGLLNVLTQSGFVNFLHEIGYVVNLRGAIALIRSLDSGDTERISEDNVRHLLREIALRAKSQLRDVLYRTRCCEAARPGVRYIPPSAGKVRVEIVRSYLPKIETKTVTPCQVMYMEKAAYVSHDPGIMLQYGVMQVRCHVREGDRLVSLLKKDLGDAVAALAKVLPQMINTTEAAKLARIHVGNSYERRQKLKALLGHAFGPLLGHFDGYYSLSMQCENDRVCLIKLMEQSLTTAAMRKELQLGDLSQNGDWYCFRNQVVDGVSVLEDGGIGAERRITKEEFTPLPSYGHVEFDFSGAMCLHGRAATDDTGAPVVAIHDHKMVRLITDCGLLPHTAPMERHAHRQLDEMRRGMERALQGFGYKYWQVDEGRAETMGQYMHEKFYGNLLDRHNQHVTANQLFAAPAAPKDEPVVEHSALKGRHGSNEKIRGKSGIGGMFGVAAKATAAAAAIAMGAPAGNVDDSSGVIQEEDDEEDEELELVDEVSDINDPKLLMRSIAAPGVPGQSKKRRTASIKAHYNAGEKIYMPSFTANLIARAGRDLGSGRPEQKFKGLKRFQTLDSVFNLLGPVHAIPVHDFFQNKMATSFMLSRHLALLVTLYDDGRAKHSDFGTYRVELVVSLFARVLDKHNFELVLMKLTAMEHACVLARLGVLSLYNPWKPDGCSYLELAHWDERQVAKMIIHLDIVEPGVNCECVCLCVDDIGLLVFFIGVHCLRL